MRKNRESSDIVERILQATAKDWISKNTAYRASNTSTTNFNKYYEAMIKADLLEHREKSTGLPRYLCRATKHGLEILPVLQKKSVEMEKLKKYL